MMNKSIRAVTAFGSSPALTVRRCLLLLVVAGLLAYANNYQGEFIFDDFWAIANNTEVHALFPMGPLLKPSANNPLAARPVVAISFALNYVLGGLDVRGYHLVNNLIHLLAGLTLFGLIRATLLLPRFGPVYGAKANGYGLAVALLWLVHPLNTEAVDYLVCRTELLVGLFYLATMFFAAIAFRSSRPRNWLVAAVATCLLGMGSKEVMVSAPLLVLLYDRLFVAGSFGVALRQRPGFYATLAATWLVVVFYQLDNPHGGAVIFDSAYVSAYDYLRTQLTIIVHYLRLCFWPHPLTLDSQDWPIVKSFSAILIWPLALLGSLGVATVVGIRQGAWWAIVGAWFFAILAPSSSFIPITTEIVAERRMYLPLVAVIVLVVFTVDHLFNLAAGRFSTVNKGVRILPIMILLIIAIIYADMTFARNGDYRTRVTIWTDTVVKRPGNSRAQGNLAKALMMEGQYDKALEHFREAVHRFPIYQPKSELGEIYSIFGACLSDTGNFQESMLMHRKALELLPDDHLVYYHLGNSYISANDLVNATVVFRKSIEINPSFPAAHGNLGLILMQQGDLVGAEAHLRRLLEISPSEVRSYSFLAELLVRQSRFVEAGELYRLGIARRVSPEVLASELSSLIDAHPEAN